MPKNEIKSWVRIATFVVPPTTFQRDHCFMWLEKNSLRVISFLKVSDLIVFGDIMKIFNIIDKCVDFTHDCMNLYVILPKTQSNFWDLHLDSVVEDKLSEISTPDLFWELVKDNRKTGLCSWFRNSYYYHEINTALSFGP